MTKEINVGIVAEGTTDHRLLNEIICSLLDKENDCLFLQPTIQSNTAGWFGVIDYCQNHIKKAGYDTFLRLDITRPIDILVIAIDGDQHKEPLLDCAARDRVYCERYRDVHACYTMRTIGEDDFAECKFYPYQSRLKALPIENRVYKMSSWVLKWCGLDTQPQSLIISIPCSMIESWIVAGLDGAVIEGTPIEEYNHLVTDYVLNHSPKYHGWPTAGGKTDFFKFFTPQVVSKWENICSICSQAKKFHDSLMAASRYL